MCLPPTPCHLGDTWRCLGLFLVVTPGGALGLKGVVAGGAAERPTDPGRLPAQNGLTPRPGSLRIRCPPLSADFRIPPFLSPSVPAPLPDPRSHFLPASFEHDGSSTGMLCTEGQGSHPREYVEDTRNNSGDSSHGISSLSLGALISTQYINLKTNL